MRQLVFLLNLPFTFLGIVPALLSVPFHLLLLKHPIALVVKVKSFWWTVGYLKGARAMTIGHLILLGPKEMKNDFEHEVIHVKQCARLPVIFPFLYLYEHLRRGYRKNCFEDEAYTLSKSHYGKANT